MMAKSLALCAAMLTVAGVAIAAEEDDLVIEGELITARAPAPAHLEGAVGDQIISGWTYRTDETQALQMDDFENPGMVFVDQARDTWEAVDGSEGKSCASCHNEPETMAGVRAEMPKWNEAAGKVLTLEDHINTCRTERMGAEAWKWNSNDMVSMTALVTLQSRGMPVNVSWEGPAQEWWERGKEMYYTRYGQLELSCASCHEQNFGNYIRADHLSQGQINGFPAYRLKNAGLVSIHNRFKGCIRDTRAETWSEGTDEFRALELYVASRGQGLDIEGPSVRQ